MERGDRSVIGVGAVRAEASRVRGVLLRPHVSRARREKNDLLAKSVRRGQSGPLAVIVRRTPRRPVPRRCWRNRQVLRARQVPLANHVLRAHHAPIGQPVHRGRIWSKSPAPRTPPATRT